MQFEVDGWGVMKCTQDQAILRLEAVLLSLPPTMEDPLGQFSSIKIVCPRCSASIVLKFAN